MGALGVPWGWNYEVGEPHPMAGRPTEPRPHVTEPRLAQPHLTEPSPSRLMRIGTTTRQSAESLVVVKGISYVYEVSHPAAAFAIAEILGLNEQQQAQLANYLNSSTRPSRAKAGKVGNRPEPAYLKGQLQRYGAVRNGALPLDWDGKLIERFKADPQSRRIRAATAAKQAKGRLALARKRKSV